MSKLDIPDIPGALFIEALGYMAENMHAAAAGSSAMYGEGAFNELVDRYRATATQGPDPLYHYKDVSGVNHYIVLDKVVHVSLGTRSGKFEVLCVGDSEECIVFPLEDFERFTTALVAYLRR